MGFTSNSFNETKSGFTWVINWDGAGHSATLASTGSLWQAAIGIATAPHPSGGTQSLGVDVVAVHKQGPHGTDLGSGNQVSMRLHLFDILSDIGTIERVIKTVAHPVLSGSEHGDTYKLKTSRLVSQNGVTITVVGTHGEKVHEVVNSSDHVTTPPVSLGGATELISPRKGKAKDFTMIDSNTEGNLYIPLTGMFTIGETPVDSVKDMVDKILNALGEDDCIGNLMIIGHGSPGSINVGNGQTGRTKGKTITVARPDGWREELLRLRCKFCKNSKVYLYGCNVGAGARGARLVFMLNQIFQCAGSVEAPTGLCYAVTSTGEDQSSSRGDTSAPTKKANPDKVKTKSKKSKCVGSMFSGNISSNKLLKWEPAFIDSISLVSGIENTELSEALFDTKNAQHLSEGVVSQFRSELSGAIMEDASQAGLAVDALIQFTATIDDKSHSMPPMAVLGGGQYLAPDWQNISLIFVLPDALAATLEKLM